MPESLPKAAKTLWESVYNKAKSDGDDEETAAKKAWGALKSAGWKKDEDGSWHKEAILNELSLVIKKASFDEETGERRWRAETSDTGNDVYEDNMTLELFSDFISRIDTNQEAPYKSQSGFWQGGMPYLSISHYPDYNGKAVPGDVRAVYVDGNYLKAKGTFDDTPLGEACWNSICEDLQDKELEPEEKIRISIGFLDYAHTHKSTGYKFERKSLEDVCAECFMGMFTGDDGGKEFTKGQLVHLALTRVPANKRTDINPDLEVERSMATQTQKEDAASIIGEEQAEELDSHETSIPKEVERAFVTKADEEVMSEELVSEDPLDEVKSMFAELMEEFKTETKEVEVEAHSLDVHFETLRSAYDEINASELSADEKLKAIQEPFNGFGTAIADSLRGDVTVEETEDASQNDLVKAFSEAMSATNQKLDLLIAQSQNREPVTSIPSRRSISPAEAVPAIMKATSDPQKPKSIKELAHNSVFGVQ